MRRIVLLIGVTWLSLAVIESALAQQKPKYAADVPKSILTPDVVATEGLGELKFFDGLPTDETTKKVYDYLDTARGVDAFLNGMPAASIHAFIMGMKQVGMDTFSMGIHSGLLDARSLWLTPNTTVIYCIAEINVKDGPTVMEVPPGVLGPVDDAYFRFVTDVGLTGPDKGKGGKYLFLPPGYDGEVPEGYFGVRTRTLRNWLLMRAFVIDGDAEKTVKSVKDRWRLYPLSEADKPREPHFVDLTGKKYNTIHASDFTFFEELNEVVQYEPANAFDPEIVGQFAAVGIKKGKPFEPDARMKKILTESAAIGNAAARAISFRPRKKSLYFYDDRQWYSPFAGGSHEFLNNGELVLDDRIIFHYMATGITPAMAQSAVGQGSAYAFTAHDQTGSYLDGGKNYRITLPKGVPAKTFWSFVVYSTQHRSLLETDQRSAGVDSSNPSLKPNEDGSYTVYFGPKPPVGKEGNWVQTMPSKGWCVLFRLYGPLEPWFEKTWKPGNIELVE
jgi:hypothetical protein